jgi:ComF family protein
VGKDKNIRGRLSELASFLLNIFYDSTCPSCDRECREHLIAPFCRECWDKMIHYNGPSCGVCGKHLISDAATTCGECLIRVPDYRSAQSVGAYDGTLRKAIVHLKFSSCRRLAAPLGKLLGSLDLPQTDIIIPVPLGKRGLIGRGFNQSALLARELSLACGAPVDDGNLIKIKDTPPQVGLSALMRKENLRGAFSMRGKLSGESVLLVDDVITTGATVSECARVLRKHGAGDIYVVSLARA